jgi:hypothetical protein
MDFYTLKGENANKFFKLNLNPGKYYSWDDVRLLLDLDDSEVKSSCEFFDGIIMNRKFREAIIKDKLQKYNIKYIPHSYLIRNYVMYGRKTVDYIVKNLYMMKILHEQCDILNKWESYKIRMEQNVYSFEEKDKFYEDSYNEFVSNNPKYKFRK